ncbi:IS3 family transposase [Cetobacterium sp. 2G large]|nr:IS3 family transposase [Cetobacterium sp. 2G large]
MTRKKYKPQTIKSMVEAPASNILKQDFSTTSTNEKIVGDITYIYIKDFWWTYLALFMDLHINKIKGWDYSTTMTTDIVLKALSKLNLNSNLTGCIIHTNQGSQYTSNDYIAKVKNLDATLSYSRKDNPYDNACIESFHSVLKKALIYQSKPKTFEETKKSLFKYIEDWYNNHRIQKKLGYLSPVDYRKQVA